METTDCVQICRISSLATYIKGKRSLLGFHWKNKSRLRRRRGTEALKALHRCVEESIDSESEANTEGETVLSQDVNDNTMHAFLLTDTHAEPESAIQRT